MFIVQIPHQEEQGNFDPIIPVGTENMGKSRYGENAVGLVHYILRKTQFLICQRIP